MTEQAVITGLGIISPLGCEVERYRAALAAGEVSMKPTPWMPKEAGSWFSSVDDFDAEDWMTPQVASGTDRFTQFAIAATTQAVADAGITGFDPLRTAIVVGTSMGGTRALEHAQHVLETQGLAAVPRKLQILAWPNMAASQIAMRYDVHGPSLTITTACAAGIDAVGIAADFIERGTVDVAITGATDAAGAIEFQSALFAGQALYGMSSPTDDPRMACRPFDRDRSGIAGCEGAAAIVLESKRHAMARGARVHGVIRGYATCADAYHPSSPNPTGEWEAHVMKLALKRAGFTGRSVSGLYAHATGTPKGDTAEIRAINDVYGDHCADLLVTSMKGHMGHPGGSAAAMNIVAGVASMARSEVLPTACTVNVDPEVRFDVVLEEPRSVDIRAIQFNGFGFGGQNSSLVITPE